MDQEDRPFNPSEHRTASRVRAFLRGEIIHSNGNSRTECTVRDLSEGGARIEAPASVTVPEFFELFIPLKGVRKRAKMMWRAGNELGLSFVEENAKPVSTPAPSGQDVEIRIKLLELEAETARLRAQLLEMQQQISSIVREKGVA